MDFKGHVAMGKARCHPLTVLDDHSRYSLGLIACADETDATAFDGHLRGATYRFFEHLRTVTAYVVFESWDHLLRPIEAAAVRPP